MITEALTIELTPSTSRLHETKPAFSTTNLDSSARVAVSESIGVEVGASLARAIMDRQKTSWLALEQR